MRLLLREPNKRISILFIFLFFFQIVWNMEIKAASRMKSSAKDKQKMKKTNKIVIVFG